MIFFATTNELKVLEARAVIPEIIPVSLDLPEIQSPDVRTVVREKLLYASRAHPNQTIVVEDTGLYADAWNGLPGAFIKWFIEGMGTRKLAEKILCDADTVTAKAVSAVGVFQYGETKIWTGETPGSIVLPRGEEFGWNSIFLDPIHDRTFGELSFEERLSVSMRKIPLQDAAHWIHSTETA